MKSLAALSLFVTLAPLSLIAQTDLTSPKDKLSYTLGLQAGEDLKKRSADLDEKALLEGIADGLKGQPRLSQSEVRELVNSADKIWLSQQAATRKAQGDKNAIEGPKFLAENKTKEGVKTTASGLQYKVLREGSGPSPKESDRVVINFTGMNIDGKKFEDSTKSGHAETVPVDRMIPGWREALLMMKPGAQYRLFLPADLAYGKAGGGVVAPNAALIFDLELVGIVPDQQTALAK